MPERTINLTFHGIGEPCRPLEQGEHQLLARSRPVRDRCSTLCVGRTDCRLTFDDGNASDVEHALPHLRRRDLTATFFVVAGRLGEPGFLNEADVRALTDAGMESAATACATVPGAGSMTSSSPRSSWKRETYSSA